MFKRVIALFLITIITVTTISSCGPKKSTSSIPSSENSISDSSGTLSDTSDTSDTSASNASDIISSSISNSSSKATISTVSMKPNENPIDSTGIDYTKISMPTRTITNKILKNYSWREPGPTTENAKRPSSVKLMKDKFGVTIQTMIVSQENFWDTLAATVASGNGPDMVELPYWNFYPNAITSDLILPAEDYIDFSTKLWADMIKIIDKYKWNNKIYVGFNGADIGGWFFYNKKMFKDKGIPTPRSYYEKDQWTWKVFKELAIKMTEKDDKGKTIVYGACSDLSLMSSTGLDLVEYDRKSGYKFNLRNSKYSTMMNMFYDLGEKGEKAIGSVPPSDIQNGKLAMLISKSWIAFNEANQLRLNGNLDWLPIPKMDDATPYYNYVDVYPSYGIVKGAKNPQAAAEFVELVKWGSLGSSICSYIPRQKNAYDVMYPPENKTPDPKTTLSAADLEMTKVMINKNYPVVTSMWQSWLDTSSFPGYIKVINNGDQWSQVVEQVYPSYDALLRSYFKK